MFYLRHIETRFHAGINDSVSMLMERRQIPAAHINEFIYGRRQDLAAVVTIPRRIIGSSPEEWHSIRRPCNDHLSGAPGGNSLLDVGPIYLQFLSSRANRSYLHTLDVRSHEITHLRFKLFSSNITIDLRYDLTENSISVDQETEPSDHYLRLVIYVGP